MVNADYSHSDEIASQSQNIQGKKCHKECELMFLEVGETLEINSLTSVWLAVLIEDLRSERQSQHHLFGPEATLPSGEHTVQSKD